MQSGSLVVAWYIEKSFPEAVRIDESGYKMVSLNALTAILLQAVKNQQKQIDELKKEIDELKNKLGTRQTVNGVRRMARGIFSF